MSWIKWHDKAVRHPWKSRAEGMAMFLMGSGLLYLFFPTRQDSWRNDHFICSIILLAAVVFVCHGAIQLVAGKKSYRYVPAPDGQPSTKLQKKTMNIVVLVCIVVFIGFEIIEDVFCLSTHEIRELILKHGDGLQLMNVEFRRAYEYDGRSHHKEKTGYRRIATIVELSKADSNYEAYLNDISILDGNTGVHCGVFPDHFVLDSEGKTASDQDDWSVGPLLVVLIYSVPESVKSVQLSHYRELVKTEVKAITGTGPTAPPLPERARLQ